MNEKINTQEHLDYILKAVEAYKVIETEIDNLEQILKKPQIRTFIVDGLQIHVPNEMSVEGTGKIKDILSDVLAKHMEEKIFLRDYLLGIADEDGNPIVPNRPETAMSNFGKAVEDFSNV